MAHIEWEFNAKVPILNDEADMRPILNGNLSIHSIHLNPKKDPFPSKLCSHIMSRMNPSQTPGSIFFIIFFFLFFLFRIFTLGRFIGSIQYRSSGQPSIHIFSISSYSI